MSDIGERWVPAFAGMTVVGMSKMTKDLILNANCDVKGLAATMAEDGCIQISDFLSDPGASVLRTELLDRADWKRIINGGNNVFETEAQTYAAMDAEERRKIEAAVCSSATHGFQFQYESIRVADDLPSRMADDSMLCRFARFMGSPETLEFFRNITGEPNILFADAQATRYRSGDFLTRHDDAVEGKNRSFAYVLALSPQWLPEWGGLLLMNDQEGGIARTVVPRFNRLVLFKVGQPHSVSFVAPYAGGDRLSITGWLRTRGP